MNRVTSDIIETYLKRYGWSYHADGQSCWMTGWQSEARAYPLIISLNDTFVSLTVAPLMKLGLEWDAWPEIMRYILDLNHDCRMVKLGIDEFGDLTLSLYAFSGRLTYEEFADALGVVGHYAERVFDEMYRHLDAIGFRWNRPAAYLV
jgi:hypothetical protein